MSSEDKNIHHQNSAQQVLKEKYLNKVHLDEVETNGNVIEIKKKFACIPEKRKLPVFVKIMALIKEAKSQE